MPKALVVGALGVVGRANVEFLTGLFNWEVVALSRRAPDFKTRAQFVSADLNDIASCRAALKDHRDITHVVRGSARATVAGFRLDGVRPRPHRRRDASQSLDVGRGNITGLSVISR